MTKRQTNTPAENRAIDSRFYLIFDRVQKAESTDFTPDVSIDEINEIDQVGRMVMEVSDDRLIFMTST
jgi:hypothetical protein